MQGQNWSTSDDQQNSFADAFMANSENISQQQEVLNSFFGQNDPNDFSQQYGPSPSQQANMMRSNMQMNSGSLDTLHVGPADNDQEFRAKMLASGIDIDQATAAAAAYSQIDYNSGQSLSRIHSQQEVENMQMNQESEGKWNPAFNAGSMSSDYANNLSNMANQMRFSGPSTNDNFHVQNNVYDVNESPANHSEDLNGKRRMITFTENHDPFSQLYPQQPGMDTPNPMHNKRSCSKINDSHSFGSTPKERYGANLDQPIKFTRPPFRHRRSRSGSEVTQPGIIPRSFGSFDGTLSTQGYPTNNQTYATLPPPPSSCTNMYPPPMHHHPHSYNGIHPLSSMEGHAASHPPGLGSQILRGVDVSASGSSAALDFTRRKGWTGRVVEELLDFVHVLDPEGKILFASPSVFNLTGWKAEEVKGRKLIEFIHPQDVSSVEREIDRIRLSKGELLTYYRFRTKPKSEVAKAGSTSKDSNDNDSSAGDTGEEKQKERQSEVEHADALTRDGEYVVFEATGHAYFPPEPGTITSNPMKYFLGKNREDEPKYDNGDGITVALGRLADQMIPESMSQSNLSSSTSQPLPQSISCQTFNNENNGNRSELQCFFCSARPYPSKNTSMLDSFLGLKLENEKLRMLIADLDLNKSDREKNPITYLNIPLQNEILDENDGNKVNWQNMIKPSTVTMRSDGRLISSMGGSRSGTILSRNNSLGSLTTSPNNRSKDDSLTGIGGGMSPHLDSDEDITNNLDDSRQKKKIKPEDIDHVCTDCGRVDSPEWRKGPKGPKTLCNACGLRWAKKVKRQEGDHHLGSAMMVHGQSMPHMMNHNHVHNLPYHRTDSSQLQNMSMAPPSMPTINMTLMGQHGLNSSPTGPPGPPGPSAYQNRPPYDDNRHGGPHGM